jgi:glycosyltransferase involved in cell wall biosynthesis
MNLTVSPSNKNMPGFDLVCFSHLRWDFVFQRPQHLMSRFSDATRVFFVEEPVFHDGEATIRIDEKRPGLRVCTPHLPNGVDASEFTGVIAEQVRQMLNAHDCDKYVAWFYTPMMIDLAAELEPSAVVYDCMDELSAFRGAPPELIEREKRLMAMADLVFTGGQSLYQAKRSRHRSVHAFPSSVDVKHFARAREINSERPEQEGIAHPRVGFAGVIDERFDTELLTAIAELRPDMQFIVVGPVVKISEGDLPRRANIHYLGMQSYDDLPAFFAGWDIAVMPFALNESTKFISPTKTPEYLAAGLPVISTAITDVVHPYQDLGLVQIVSTAEEFSAALDTAVAEDASARQKQADEFLTKNSWDKTFAAMLALIEEAVDENISQSAVRSALAAAADGLHSPATAAVKGDLQCSTI